MYIFNRYLTLFYKLRKTSNLLNDQAAWCNWKNDIPLESLFSFSRIDLSQELLTAIQTKYVNHKNPTDHIAPLNNFLKDYIIGTRKASNMYLNRYGNKIYKKDLRYVFDVNSNTVLFHEYYEGVNIEDIKNQYKRRYMRMVNDVKNTTDITLVHYYPSEDDVVIKKHNKIMIENLGFNVSNRYDTNVRLQDVEDSFNKINPKARIKSISYIDIQNEQQKIT